MYQKALDSGVSILDFWELSIPEVQDAIRSYERRVKLEVSHKFFLATSIAEQIGTYLNSENKARNLWDFFPGMFAEEKKEYEKMEAEAQVKKAAENRKRYAEELNRRRRNGTL